VHPSNIKTSIIIIIIILFASIIKQFNKCSIFPFIYKLISSDCQKQSYFIHFLATMTAGSYIRLSQKTNWQKFTKNQGFHRKKFLEMMPISQKTSQS